MTHEVADGRAVFVSAYEADAVAQLDFADVYTPAGESQHRWVFDPPVADDVAHPVED